LPAPVVAAIRLHHSLDCLGSDPTVAEVHTRVAASVLADWLVTRHAGLPQPPEWAHDGDAALVWFDLALDDLLHWEDRLRPALDAA
jgi:hypothetical protein